MSVHGEGPTGEDGARGAWLRLWPWIVVVALLRAWLALSCADVYFYGEELAKGTCAKVILEGPAVPYWKAVYGYHEGGGFVVVTVLVARRGRFPGFRPPTDRPTLQGDLQILLAGAGANG